MDKYLVAVDLDDTFLTREKKITPKSIDFVKRMKSQGSDFIIDTGRPFQSASDFLKMMEVNLPVIVSNGGTIVFFKDDLYTIDRAIQFPIRDEVILSLMERTLPIVDNITLTCLLDYYSLDLKKTLLWVLHPDKRVAFHEGQKELFQARNVLDAEFYVYRENVDRFLSIVKEYPGIEFIHWQGEDRDTFEVSSIESDKGKAMLLLASLLGIRKENTFGFGDQLNDLPLIEDANYGVSMINGVEEVRKRAKYVTTFDADHDGVVEFVKDTINRKEGKELL